MTSGLFPVEGRVVEVREETADTKTLVIETEEGAMVSSFRPGQFNMVGLPGIGEVPITFSIIMSPHRFAHTIRQAGRVTSVLLRLQPGQTVQTRGPFGSAWPWKEMKGKDVLIIAGGAGIIPFRPLIEAMFQERDDFGRITILYGARTPGDMVFFREARAWRDQPDTVVRLTVDDPPGGGWEEDVGVVTTLMDHPSRGVPAHYGLVCGPELMMRFAVRELLVRGMAPHEIFLSMERHMKCGIGHCGHCQLGTFSVCLEGPVFPYGRLKGLPDTML